MIKLRNFTHRVVTSEAEAERGWRIGRSGKGNHSTASQSDRIINAGIPKARPVLGITWDHINSRLEVDNRAADGVTKVNRRGASRNIGLRLAPHLKHKRILNRATREHWC